MDDETEAAMDAEIVGPVASAEDAEKLAAAADGSMTPYQQIHPTLNGVLVDTATLLPVAADADGEPLPFDQQPAYFQQAKLRDMGHPVNLIEQALSQVVASRHTLSKLIRFEDGPADGKLQTLSQMPSDGLICFFCESSPGQIQQAVYKIMLKEIEATDEEKAAAKEKAEILVKRYEWVGEYMGKRRHTPPQNVNGCRKV